MAATIGATFLIYITNSGGTAFTITNTGRSFYVWGVRISNIDNGATLALDLRKNSGTGTQVLANNGTPGAVNIGPNTDRALWGPDNLNIAGAGTNFSSTDNIYVNPAGAGLATIILECSVGSPPGPVSMVVT